MAHIMMQDCEVARVACDVWVFFCDLDTAAAKEADFVIVLMCTRVST